MAYEEDWGHQMPVDVVVDVVIDRPIEDVAAFAGDLSNTNTWYESVESAVWKTQPPVMVGSQVDLVVNAMGRRSTYTYEVVEYVPGERLAMRTTDGPMTMETVYTWTPLDARHTRMAIHSHAEPGGLAKIGTPVMSAGIKRTTQRDLNTLKQILENK